jgi:hypothetical protein
MSVISAILTKDFIIVSSDSILTFEVDGKKLIDDDSYTKPKYVSFPILKCIISYWGLAYIKVGQDKVWQTYEWLQSMIDKQLDFSSIEDFGKHLKNDLESVFAKYHLRNPLEYGIGLHLIGFETFEDKQIPELYLLSNYKSPEYNAIGSLDLSRRTIFDLFKGQVPDMPLIEQRKLYLHVLSQAGFSFYNNGDPIMFNLFANTYHNSVLIAKSRGKLKGALDKIFYIKLCSEPINQVSKFQKEYYLEGSVIVGGKTHTIVMNSDGSID